MSLAPDQLTVAGLYAYRWVRLAAERFGLRHQTGTVTSVSNGDRS